MAPRTTTKRPVEVPDFEGVPEVAPTVLKSVQGLLAAHASSDHELAKAVLKALRTRDGRSQRCTRDELPERLEQDGVTFDPDELDEVLSRLWDVGQIVLAQRNTGYPLFIVVKGVRALDDIDVLAADVCSAVKRRGEQLMMRTSSALGWTRTGLVTTSGPWPSRCVSSRSWGASPGLCRSGVLSRHLQVCTSRHVSTTDHDQHRLPDLEFPFQAGPGPRHTRPRSEVPGLPLVMVQSPGVLVFQGSWCIGQRFKR
jgi:hypothetical protein